MSKEVRIEYDYSPHDAIDAIGGLLEEKGLEFVGRWEDTTLHLKIREKCRSVNQFDEPRESQFEYKGDND